MKRYSVLIMLISLLILGGCGLNNVQEQNEQGGTNGTSETVKKISEQEALDVVLKDIGAKEEDVVIGRIKKDFDDGRFVYEIEIYYNDFEYDYDIDESGAIVKSEKEALKTQQVGADKVEQGISEQEALTIALEHANLTEAEVSMVKIEKDFDYPTYTYEIDFYTKDSEYEYEITIDGVIIKSEQEKH